MVIEDLPKQDTDAQSPRTRRYVIMYASIRTCMFPSFLYVSHLLLNMCLFASDFSLLRFRTDHAFFKNLSTHTVEERWADLKGSTSSSQQRQGTHHNAAKSPRCQSLLLPSFLTLHCFQSGRFYVLIAVSMVASSIDSHGRHRRALSEDAFRSSKFQFGEILNELLVDKTMLETTRENLIHAARMGKMFVLSKCLSLSSFFFSCSLSLSWHPSGWRTLCKMLKHMCVNLMGV